MPDPLYITAAAISLAVSATALVVAFRRGDRPSRWFESELTEQQREDLLQTTAHAWSPSTSALPFVPPTLTGRASKGFDRHLRLVKGGVR